MFECARTLTRGCELNVLPFNTTYRIFLYRSRGYYFLFLNILCGFYSRAASIQRRVLFFLYKRFRLQIGVQ